MLYAAGFVNNKIEHQANTISVFDTEEVLEKFTKNKSIKLYEDAHSKEKAFDVWKETYEQKSSGDLIFSDDTIAYNIGEKPLRKRDLKQFNPKDKIVNKFEEILRHNNVSDKENAFNKLVALFICKLVDEITKKDDDIVDFQYKFGTDTYETLLDRLQRLYKEGMDKFMKEEIFYVSSEYPLNLFSNYKGQNRKNAINDLKETFRKLKFYSNSDFAFKDVHNEQLFVQNGKILVEVVKLFENYKIVYSSKHQFLGDLFEQLLNQGFKQNEGQFFTPMPITRFIWESLPIESITKNLKGDKYPKVIDYACGSGHFLTEGIETINSVINSDNNDWVGEKIYGIEKDYRLARVSKISLFMNGAGSGNIVFGDGLDNHKDKGITNNNFDILVANPPYSVKAFKSHLKLQDNDFEILDLISNDGGEIEVLFIERISQLLKAKGIAAVILPAPILSNTSNSYMGARESIIKNFKIKAIVQLGDKTFGATGTNTVVLFLEKYNEPPKHFQMMMDSVLAIFNNQVSNEWEDNEILTDYLEHIGVDKDYYIAFINEATDIDDYQSDDYFKAYYEDFSKSKKVINTTNSKSFSKLSDDEKKKRKNAMFFSYAKEIEKEKLFYFALVRNDETLVIKAPKGKEQQDFLGYKWSGRAGSEGIQIFNNGGLLFDEVNRDSKNRIAPLVRAMFNDKDISVSATLEDYVEIFETKNMFDFEREKFDKSINLIERKTIHIDSKFDVKPLGEVCHVLIGGTPSRKNGEFFKGDNLWVSIKEMNGQVINDTKEKITDEAVKKSNVKPIPKGTTLLSFKLSIGKTAIAGKKLYTNEAIAGLIPINNQVLDSFIYYLFKSNLIKLENYIGDKAFGKSLNSTILKKDVKIPVPPIDVQEKIIDECKKVESVYEKTRMKIVEYQAKIQDIFAELEVVKNDGGGVQTK
ncbi:N-6 DNA methylase [Streptococcus oralis]|uniref:N-6 DNA methylase n=1 Tax=Streptococcus oralis TaxID=1303 RepID=UPI0022838BA0|nr:N-6 DNA methylase [Streptococcus oralis]MCY7109500.1 N-6 DNA methylase [Streptococcus oralis]